MPRIDSNIDIKAPREKVFAYISDVESQPEWCKWAKRAAVTSPTQGVGATDEMVMQVGPRKERVEGIVTEYKSPQFFTRRNTRGLQMTESYSLLPAGDGTKVAWIVEYSPPGGGIGKLIDFLFMSRLFEQLQGDSLRNLKERLESTR
jgi:uncharacterized membrane protein